METVLSVLAFIGQVGFGFILMWILWEVKDLIHAKTLRDIALAKGYLDDLGRCREADKIKMPR